MTRRHFEAIARGIASAKVSAEDRRKLAESVADMLPAFNPRFDRARFLAAVERTR